MGSVDLRPKTLDVKTIEGDSWSVKATCPFDITGFDIEARIKLPNGTTTDLDVSVTDAGAGIFYYGQSVAVAGTSLYDIRLTAPGGLPRTYAKGKVRVDVDAVV